MEMAQRIKCETPKIRVALIGYGYAGRVFHAPLIRSVAGLELTVVGSTRKEAVAVDLPGVHVCPATAVASRADVDLVVIATPNDSHYPLAADALRSGKSVVIDKPFTVSLDEARSLLELGRQHGQVLTAFHNRRWDSEILASKAIIESGALGEISHFECHMDRFRPNVRHRWREDAGLGAGLWFDLGPHLIDVAVYLFGLPHSVNANFGTMREGGETDDWAHIQLNYDRLRVILHASLLVSGGAPRTIIHGSAASWAKYGADIQEAQLSQGVLPSAPGFGDDLDPGVLYEGTTGKKIEIPVPKGDQSLFYSGVRDAIRRLTPLPIPVDDVLAGMAILQASFDSGRQEKTLPIPLTASERLAWLEARHLQLGGRSLR